MQAWIERELDVIERDYNAFNDVASPKVSYTEWVLLQAVKGLIDRIDKLEAKNELAECVAIYGVGH